MKDYSLDIRQFMKILLFVVGAYIAWQLREFVLVLLTSIVIAAFIESGTRILARIKIPRLVAVIFMYAVGIGLLVAVLYVIVPIFLRELVELVALFPAGSPISDLLSPFTRVIETVQSSGVSLISSDPFYVLSRLTSEFSTSGFLKNAGNIFGGVVNVLLIFVFSFYFAITDRGVDAFLRAVTPVDQESRVLGLWQRTEKKIGAWFRGQALLALIVAVMTYIGLLVLGVPYALILALMVFIAEFIPFGVIPASIPAILIGFIGEGPVLALLVAGLYFVVQQFEGYILQPYVVGRVTGVPSIIILIAVVAGVQIAGVYGLILSVPVSVLLVEIIRDREEARARAMAG